MDKRRADQQAPHHEVAAPQDETAEEGRPSEPAAGDEDGHEFLRGIAFVHGIGEQKIGESLTAFAETVGLWLQQWLTGNPDTDLPVTRAELEPAQSAVGVAISETVVSDPSAPETPAHTVLTICRAGKPDRKVLIAECWWADAFEPPRLRELVVWILFIAPRLVMSHTSAPLRRSWRRAHMVSGALKTLFLWLRMLLQLSFFLSSFALIPALVVVFVAILFPAVVPITTLRDAARRAATLVVGYLGDTFIVTMSPVRRDLVTRAVLDDLDWLVNRCDEVAIVAHSQGAVLTHDALRRETPSKLTHLITFGAGLEKLLRLRLLFHGDRGTFRRQWLGVAAALALIVAIFAAISALAANHITEGIWLAGFAGGCVLVMIGGMVLAFRNAPGYEELVKLKGAGEQFTWLNLYASSDPVPNGPLIEQTRAWIQECEVFNYASILRDHTAYLKNRDDVVPRIVMTVLGDLLYGDDLAGEESSDWEALERGRTRRRIRVRLLTIGRSLILAAGVAVTAAIWPTLDAFGRTIRRHLPGTITQPVRHLFVALPHKLNTPQGRGAAAWIIAWLLAAAAFTLVLSLWGRLDARYLILREDPQSDRTAPLRVLAGSLVSAIVLSLVAVAITAGLTDQYTTGLGVALIVLSGSAAIGVVLSLSAGPRLLDKIETHFEDRWREQSERESYEPLRARTKAAITKLSPAENLRRLFS